MTLAPTRRRRRVRPAPDMPQASLTYRLAAATAFSVMRVQRWRFIVRGLEHVPLRGGVVVTGNHTSYTDYFTVGRAPYLELGRPVRILAKASLFRLPVFGAVMRWAQHIPVQRGAGSHALDAAVAALRAGELVGVLPEQTISPSFDLLPFKTGAARMAIEAGVPIVPAVSWGTHRFVTVLRRPRLAWRLPVVVLYGPPIVTAPGDDPAAITEELRRRTQDLLDEAVRTHPDGCPAGAWWVPARLGGGAMTQDEARDYLDGLSRTWQRQTDRRQRRGRTR
jgi:1-acyl-sn-glycerol-3-phosphate acyltransferase